MVKVNYKKIACCSYCTNYEKSDSGCSIQNKELDIEEELIGCEKLDYNGRLDIHSFDEIPQDSNLRKLTIEDLARSHTKLRCSLESHSYSNHANSIYNPNNEKIFNLSKIANGKIIAFDRDKDADAEITRLKIINSIMNRD